MNEDVLPVFVKIEEYKDVVDIVRLLKEKLRLAKQSLAEIHKLRDEEEDLLHSWSNSVEDVDSKILFIEKTLFEPKGL